MKFFDIFALKLYAVEFDDNERKQLGVSIQERSYKGNEYSILLKKWTNVEYLRNFYDDNKTYFSSAFWSGVTKNDFVLSMVQCVPRMLKEIAKISQNNQLDVFFQPLDDRIYKIKNLKLLEVKAKHGKICGKLAVRIYAIKFGNNCYLLTGGAIKITEKLDQHPLTNLEILKLRLVKSYLQNQDVIDCDSFEDFKGE